MYKYLLVFGFLNLMALSAFAQKPDTAATHNKTDSITRVSDSLKTKKVVPTKITAEKKYHPDSLHSPHKAVIRSLMVPGWGQLYNHQWWKVPVIYAGIGLLIDAVIFNQKYYSEFVTIAKYQERGYTPKPTDKYYTEYNYYVSNNVPSTAIISASDAYRRNRDLCILGTLGAWGIQAIDAYIDAKFQHSYTMDNNFSLKVSPSVVGQPVYAATTNNVSFVTGLRLTFTF